MLASRDQLILFPAFQDFHSGKLHANVIAESGEEWPPGDGCRSIKHDEVYAKAFLKSRSSCCNPTT